MTRPPVTPDSLADPHDGHPPHAFTVEDSEIALRRADLRAAARPRAHARRARRGPREGRALRGRGHRRPRRGRPDGDDLPVSAGPRPAHLGDAGRAARRPVRGARARRAARAGRGGRDRGRRVVDAGRHRRVPGLRRRVGARVPRPRPAGGGAPCRGRRRGGRPRDPPGAARRPRHRGDGRRAGQRPVRGRGVRRRGGARREVPPRPVDAPWIDKPSEFAGRRAAQA